MVHNLIKFLNNSPVNFLAIASVENLLKEAGFNKIDPTLPFPELQPGDAFYVTKNDSSLYAFHIGSEPIEESGFRLICSHCDSPTFRIKPNPEILEQGRIVKLNTELYGGAIMRSWFDRPLSIAGRVIVKGADPLHPSTELLHIKRSLMQIPSLPIHFNRQVNEGTPLSKQKDMLPIISLINDSFEKDQMLIQLIAEELNIACEDILDFDLYLYDTTPACLVGLHNEFISAGRLDDLSMVHASVEAMLNTRDSIPNTTQAIAIFDNEETGSMTKQGAGSPFFSQLLQRIVTALGGTTEDYFRAIENAFMISADNAHAWHPNYPEKFDTTNRPMVGGGPVIKYNASQKYASDAFSASVFIQVCENANVPVQKFVNHSDIAGGSTLGNILTSSLPINGVDMGNPIWAMHSIREMGAVVDQDYCIKAFTNFFEI